MNIETGITQTELGTTANHVRTTDPFILAMRRWRRDRERQQRINRWVFAKTDTIAEGEHESRATHRARGIIRRTSWNTKTGRRNMELERRLDLGFLLWKAAEREERELDWDTEAPIPLDPTYFHEVEPADWRQVQIDADPATGLKDTRSEYDILISAGCSSVLALPIDYLGVQHHISLQLAQHGIDCVAELLQCTATRLHTVASTIFAASVRYRRQTAATDNYVKKRVTWLLRQIRNGLNRYGLVTLTGAADRGMVEVLRDVALRPQRPEIFELIRHGKLRFIELVRAGDDPVSIQELIDDASKRPRKQPDGYATLH